MFTYLTFHIKNWRNKCVSVLRTSEEMRKEDESDQMHPGQAVMLQPQLHVSTPSYLTITKSPSVHFEALRRVVTSSSVAGWRGG